MCLVNKITGMVSRSRVFRRTLIYHLKSRSAWFHEFLSLFLAWTLEDCYYFQKMSRVSYRYQPRVLCRLNQGHTEPDIIDESLLYKLTLIHFPLYLTQTSVSVSLLEKQNSLHVFLLLLIIF